MNKEIHYKLSTRMTKNTIAKHLGHSRLPDAHIIIYLPYLKGVLWKEINKDKGKNMLLYKSLDNAFFVYLAYNINFLFLLERICLGCRINNWDRVENNLPKIRIKGRCKPYKKSLCKMQHITRHIFDLMRD